MKAKTALHLHGGGQIVKLTDTFEEVCGKFALMARSQPGSAYEFTRVTDHGSLKRIVIPAGHIQRIEEL